MKREEYEVRSRCLGSEHEYGEVLLRASATPASERPDVPATMVQLEADGWEPFCTWRYGRTIVIQVRRRVPRSRDERPFSRPTP